MDKDSTVANFATVQNERGRIVTKNIDYYNLDIIIFLDYYGILRNNGNLVMNFLKNE